MARCVKAKSLEVPATVQLHHLSDISEKVSGTVSWLKLINKKGEAHLSFMIGKSRVAPLKQMTIP